LTRVLTCRVKRIDIENLVEVQAQIELTYLL
jgi:hypothetical protein